MASTTLYPPIVDSYTSAFIASGDSASCRVYYSLSKFSSSANEIKSIHISVVNQTSGKSVINKKDGNNRFRSTGIIILNSKPVRVPGQENLYYIDILNEDIEYDGWTMGWKYKIQLRFSIVDYTDKTIGLASWLNLNAHNFSEWSTYTTTKAIGKPEISIPNFNYNSAVIGNSGNKKEVYSIFTSTLELTGSYSNPDEKEILYSYKLKLYNADGGLVEESKLIYANQYTPNQIYYLFETECKDNEKYKLELSYETLNRYVETKTFDFHILLSYSNAEDVRVLTAEDGDIMQSLTSIEAEQADGRIALKLHSETSKPYFGNICIRRSDSATNFTIWEDIKIIPVINEYINNLPLVYDYTIESGVWYKYGVQVIDNSGFRSALVERKPIKREFEYSFILGEDNQQLRLLFDNTVSSFKHSYSESKTDTIGGQYPFITRNGNMNYKSFPISGLISFNMDEDNLFTNMKDIYKYQPIVDLYSKEEKTLYNYTYERDFRNKVLAFLEDGKPKLFKSPTEGNIIVRLMDVNTTPNQTLSRLVYSFTANAYEIAEAKMENYLKYNFYTVGEYKTELRYTETKLGQYIGTVPVNSNLFEIIKNKYNKNNVLGYSQEIVGINNIVLHFPGQQLAIVNNANQLTAGHNIKLNDSIITVYNNIYVFDELASFSPDETLIILGDKDNKISEIEIEIDFTYSVAVEPAKEKVVSFQTVSKNIGQFAEVMYSGDSIYTKTYYKYYYNWNNSFRKLYELKCVCIEAAPNSVFEIKDLEDSDSEKFVINSTGILDLYDVGTIRDIVYVGMQTPNGEIEYDTPSDVIVDYVFYLIEGKYVKEG